MTNSDLYIVTIAYNGAKYHGSADEGLSQRLLCYATGVVPLLSLFVSCPPPYSNNPTCLPTMWPAFAFWWIAVAEMEKKMSGV